MFDPARWPPLPDTGKDDPQADTKKALYQAMLQIAVAERQAQLDAAKAQAAADVERERGVYGVEHDTYQAIYQAYIDVAKAAIDRTTAAAEFIQKSAAAIATLYTSVLALTYSIKEGQQLPPRGFLPTLFLAMAILLSTAYLAFVTQPNYSNPAKTSGVLQDNQMLRLNDFINWVIGGSLRRGYMLRSAVISLIFGVGFLPIPFLQVTDEVAGFIAIVCVPFVFVLSYFIPKLIRNR